MIRPAIDLYNTLIKEAIDCSTIRGFTQLAEMSTAHAERRIISLLESGKLYTYNGRFIVKHFNRLCFIYLNKVPDAINVGCMGLSIAGVEQDIEPEEINPQTVRIDLPFSPKHLCGGRYKCRDIRRVADAGILNHILMAITK